MTSISTASVIHQVAIQPIAASVVRPAWPNDDAGSVGRAVLMRQGVVQQQGEQRPRDQSDTFDALLQAGHVADIRDGGGGTGHGSLQQE